MFLLVCSNAIRQRKVLLLSVPHQRAAVDLAADALLHHLSPVELQTGVYCLHTHCCEVCGRTFSLKLKGRRFMCISFVMFGLQLCCCKDRSPQRAGDRRFAAWDHSWQSEAFAPWALRCVRLFGGVDDLCCGVLLQKPQDLGSETQLNASSLKEALERFSHSRTPSASSRSSHKSHHTNVSDPACKTASWSRPQPGVQAPCPHPACFLI